MIQLLFVPPGGKLQKRGRPIRVSALSNLNRDNELIVGFDDTTWKIVKVFIQLYLKYRPRYHLYDIDNIRFATSASE